MKYFRLYLVSALLSLVCLFANGQINYNSNTLTTQPGYYPSALGSGNTANGKFSLVGGTNSSANGECSFGFGNATFATGKNSFAFGYQSEANSDYSLALGYLAKNNSTYSVAIGSNLETTASSTFSMLLGRFLKSTASQNITLGIGVNNSQPMTNGVANSIMFGMLSSVPTLFISASSGSTQTGKIGIGNITSPTAKLHLLSDAGEAAELKLEHRTTGLRQYSEIYLGTHTIRAGNAENMVFTTPAGKNFAFEEGKVGVGTTDPGSKLQVTGGDVFVEDINSGIIMKSPDGRCWRGTMTNEGVMAFAETLCPSGSGYVAQPAEPETLGIRIYPNPSGGRFTIESSGSLNKAIVSIFTVDGKLLMEYNLEGSSKLQTDGFASGTYVVTITANGRTLKSQQVIVNQ